MLVIADRDGDPIGGESDGDRAPEPCGSSGDQRDTPSFLLPHVSAPLRSLRDC
jgi:hypothetical protein